MMSCLEFGGQRWGWHSSLFSVPSIFQDIECSEAEADVAGTTMAIYTVQAEGDDHDGPGGLFADVGMVLEGVKVLNNLKSINHACVMLYGLIYALNLSYPKNVSIHSKLTRRSWWTWNRPSLPQNTSTETQIAQVTLFLGWGGDGRRKYRKRPPIHADNHVFYSVPVRSQPWRFTHRTHRKLETEGAQLTMFYYYMFNVVEPVEFVLSFQYIPLLRSFQQIQM